MDLMDGDQLEWMNSFGAITYPGADSYGNGDAQRYIQSDDPRRRYYFYRQAMTTPGQASMLWFSGAGPYVWPLSFAGAQDYTVTEEQSFKLW